MSKYLSKEEKKVTKDLLQFIEKSPSMFHVVQNLKEELLKGGARELAEGENWKLETGERYFVTRNDSSLIAFTIPKKIIKGFHVMTAHSDSPSFKIKYQPEMVVEDTYVKLNVEKYGGMIMSTWLDRPLSFAGRVAVKRENQVVCENVDIAQDLLVIPNVAIHMNRQINEGFNYNPQVDMLPLMAIGDRKVSTNMVKELLAKQLKEKAENILDYDLFLYVREKGRLVGAEEEFMLSPKLDDLQSVFAGLCAFNESKPKEFCNVLAVFDNEEVGSGTKQGADSTFLEDVLGRIQDNFSDISYRELVANSFLISADNGHAVHPNHPEKADPTNRPVLNGGLIIKYHGGQKYTSDAFSAGKMRMWCEQAGVPVQSYTNRSDIAGGSTLGNISTAHVSVASVDIGFPQLAMHSCMETGGSKDTALGIAALKCFYTE